MAQIYLPNFTKALGTPRVQVPESGMSHALQVGIGQAASSLAGVAEVWRDKQNFKAQSERMAQALEKEGMPQEAAIYRAASQNAEVNFFSDPATNRKAQQGLLSDALKIIEQKQENELRKELALQSESGALKRTILADSLASSRQKEERAAEAKGYNAILPSLNAANPEMPPLPELPTTGDVAPPPASLLPEIPTNDPNRKARIDLEREKLRDTQEERARLRADSEKFKAEIAAREANGENIKPHYYKNYVTGYDVVDPTGRVTTTKGVRYMMTPDGDIVERPYTTTTTSGPATQQRVDPAASWLKGVIESDQNSGPDDSLFGGIPFTK